MVVIFGLEQLMSGEVRVSNKTMGKATKCACEFDPGGAYTQLTFSRAVRQCCSVADNVD